MTKRFFGSLAAGILAVTLSAADGELTLKSARSIRIEVEKPSKRIGAPSFDENYQARDLLVPAERFLTASLPELLPGDESGDTVTIKVGTNVLGAKYGLPELEREEFLIDFPDANTILIAGGDQIGARNGVSEFLQRFCGVRWLFPGEAGLHLPKHAELKIPMEPVRGKPHFHQRTLSRPYPWKNRTDWNYGGWYDLNRSNWDISFTHNLYVLFPWKTYSKTHPEFYPKDLGPNPANDHWNPVLNAPGLTEEAIKRICEQFRRSPEQRSYSLGMNDTFQFEGAEPKGRNSVGVPDYSDYYYGWVNKVIAGVTEKYPDRFFGMIAYGSAADPPSFELDRRAVPFICIERLCWCDPAMEEKDRARTMRWQEKTTRLGWYDYIYGDMYYMIPRCYPHLMAKYLKFAAQNGVTDYYAEANCTELPTEGPKTWLVLQLLWNPDADADALLDEWYMLAVGEEAAPHLRNYYGFWEKYWGERVVKSEWFDRYKNSVYFDFWDHNYMKDLSLEDITYCQNEMDQVLTEARTPEQKRRAEIFLKTWEQVKSNILYFMNFHHPVKGVGEKAVFRDGFNTRDSLKSNEHPLQGSWIFWQMPTGKARGEWEENGGIDGSGALTVHLENSKRWCFTRACKTSPGTIYRFRCRIRAENTGDSGKLYVAAYWRDKNNVQVNKYFLTRLLEPDMRDGQWHTVEIQFSEPPIEKPYLNLHIGGTGVRQGVFRLDDAEFSEVLSE